MEYTVRRAEEQELPEILKLYENARAFMASAGNPSQWGKTEPREELLRQDLQRGTLYVVTNGEDIHGVFAFLQWEDPTYGYIEGQWHFAGPYGVIHRVASDGSGGILKAAVAYAQTKNQVLRIDTHRDNLPMQRAIGRLGFAKCGVIYTEAGSPRLAYDRFREIPRSTD